MRRILVADDSSTVRNVVAHAFRGTDVEVLEAASGEEALEIARRERPDLVLCDVLMMGMSGYEVAEALAEDRVPVLLLTGPFEPFDEERARRAGSVGYLAKPFEPRLLVERVREILGAGSPGEAPAPASPTAPPSAPGDVLSSVPAPPAPGSDEGPLEVPGPSRGRSPVRPPARVPLPGDADFDLGGGLPPAPSPAPPAAPAPPPDVVREEVRRAVAELAPGIVREVAWEVVPDLLERLLREAAPLPPSPRSPGDEDR